MSYPRITLKRQGTLREVLDSLATSVKPPLRWQANSRAIFVDRLMAPEERKGLLTLWKENGSQNQENGNFWPGSTGFDTNDDLDLLRPVLLAASNADASSLKYVFYRKKDGPFLTFFPYEACKPWVPENWDPKSVSDIHAYVDDPEVRKAMLAYRDRNVMKDRTGNYIIDPNFAIIVSACFSFSDTESICRSVCKKLMAGPIPTTPQSTWGYSSTPPFRILASFGRLEDEDILRRAVINGVRENVIEEWAKARKANQE